MSRGGSMSRGGGSASRGSYNRGGGGGVLSPNALGRAASAGKAAKTGSAAKIIPVASIWSSFMTPHTPLSSG